MVLSGKGRFRHVGKVQDGGRHCGSTRAQLEDAGMAPCLLVDLARLAPLCLPADRSHGHPVRWQESGAKLPVEPLREGEQG